MKPRLPDAPPQIRALPLDPRGYPIPWFVGTNPRTGDRDFRVIHTEQVARAVKDRRCWICGRKLGEFCTFAIGPMCAVNRVSSEPPSHLDCARFAVKACPFLTNPEARRDPRNLPIEEDTTPGLKIERNPGATLLWRARRYKWGPDRLFHLGDPVAVEWWAQGRPATRVEVLASIESGLPIFENECALDDDPDASRRVLAGMVEAALELVPPA